MVLRSAVGLLAIALAVVACSDEEETEPAVSEITADAGDEPREEPKEAASSTPVYEVDCPIGVAVEHEPNDTKDSATSFDELSFCGVLSTGDDVDYATFVVPEGKKVSVFQGVITGKIDFELTAGGKTFGPADTEQFTGGTWLVKTFAKDKQPGKYRFRIQFN